MNDLHKAAGGADKDKPSNWLASAQTQELIAEIEAGNPASKAVHIIRGRNLPQGTYVVKELVYAYAMWISPAFHLKVIRAYDRYAVASSEAGWLLKGWPQHSVTRGHPKTTAGFLTSPYTGLIC